MSTLDVLAVSARTASLILAPKGDNYTLAAPAPWSLTEASGTEVQSGIANSVGVFLDELSPETQYHFTSEHGSTSFTTDTCAGLIEASDYGVNPESSDNFETFKQAVSAVPAGGTLRVPAGIFKTRPLFLKNDMTLLLESGAVLSGIADRNNWPFLRERDEQDRVLGTWEGLPADCYAAVVTGIDCDNLTITGRGTIDGGGAQGDWWNWPKETRNGARRPRTLHLLYSSRVTLTGITVCNSPSWTVHPYLCSGLHVSNLLIQNPSDSPNTDGLNPEGCDSVDIIATKFSVGDDCIAIKSGKRTDDGGADHLVPTRNIQITHCRMERGHGAVVLGSEMSGGISDVTISHCEFNETDRGVRLKTRRGRGGVISALRVSDVTMTNVPTPLAINALYFCDHDGKSDWVQSRQPAKVDETTPIIRDITLKNVTATGVELAAVAALGLPEAPIENVKIDTFRVSYAADAQAEVPLMALGVPAVRHERVFAEFADVTGTIDVLTQKEKP